MKIWLIRIAVALFLAAFGALVSSVWIVCEYERVPQSTTSDLLLPVGFALVAGAILLLCRTRGSATWSTWSVFAAALVFGYHWVTEEGAPILNAIFISLMVFLALTIQIYLRPLGASQNVPTEEKQETPPS